MNTFSFVSRLQKTRTIACLLALVSILSFGLSSCGLPIFGPGTQQSISVKGAFILNEGLWRQDNATLSRFDRASSQVVADFFGAQNPGLRIGDTANNMVLKGDTLYIVVSTSRSIEIMQVSTGKSLGRIRIASTAQEPRKMAILNDTTAFVTTLDDSIIEINPRTFTIRTPRIAVGPAPEGIAAGNRFVVIANSGFGDFRASEAKAGTLSVIDVATRQETRTIQGLPNIGDVVVNADKSRFYASYRHLPSKKDSLGGIVEFDANTMQELRRWRMKSPSALNLTVKADSLYYLGENTVECIALREQSPQPTVIFRKTEANAFWYGLSVNPETSELWICNARDFTVNGEVIVMKQGNMTPLRRFDVGINPNTVVFY